MNTYNRVKALNSQAHRPFPSTLDNRLEIKQNYQSVTNINQTLTLFFPGIQLTHTDANPWFGRKKDPSEVFDPWYIATPLDWTRLVPHFTRNLHLHFNLCKFDWIGSKGTEDRQRQRDRDRQTDQEIERERDTMMFHPMRMTKELSVNGYEIYANWCNWILRSGYWFAPTNQLLSTNWRYRVPPTTQRKLIRQRIA